MTGQRPRRILVTDQHERSGLAVTRSLAAAGYDVTAVAPSLIAPGLWSRYPHRRHQIASTAKSVDAFLTALESLLGRHQHALVLPVSDDALSVISRFRSRLEALVEICLPADIVVQTALDRSQLGPAAMRAGLSTPAERWCNCVDEAVTATRELGLPAVIKPGPTVVTRGSVMTRRGAQIVETENEVIGLASGWGKCLVQRILPGPVISVAGVLARGAIRAHVASRYLRTWPPQGGNASFSEVFTASPGLIDRVEALLVGLGWEGMFELELIEGEDGMAAIDLNPRPHGSLSLAMAAGVPLPAIWAGWCLGSPPAYRPARTGTRYRWEDGDMRSILWHLRNGGGLRSLPAGRPRRRVAHAYFRASDPAPVIARGIQFVQQEGPQFVARVSRRRGGG